VHWSPLQSLRCEADACWHYRLKCGGGCGVAPPSCECLVRCSMAQQRQTLVLGCLGSSIRPGAPGCLALVDFTDQVGLPSGLSTGLGQLIPQQDGVLGRGQYVVVIDGAFVAQHMVAVLAGPEEVRTGPILLLRFPEVAPSQISPWFSFPEGGVAPGNQAPLGPADPQWTDSVHGFAGAFLCVPSRPTVARVLDPTVMEVIGLLTWAESIPSPWCPSTDHPTGEGTVACGNPACTTHSRCTALCTDCPARFAGRTCRMSEPRHACGGQQIEVLHHMEVQARSNEVITGIRLLRVAGPVAQVNGGPLASLLTHLVWTVQVAEVPLQECSSHVTPWVPLADDDGFRGLAVLQEVPIQAPLGSFLTAFRFEFRSETSESGVFLRSVRARFSAAAPQGIAPASPQPTRVWLSPESSDGHGSLLFLDRYEVRVDDERMGLVSLRFASVAAAGVGRGLPSQGRLRAQALFSPLPELSCPSAMAVDRPGGMGEDDAPVSSQVYDLLGEVTEYNGGAPFGVVVVPGPHFLHCSLLDLVQEHHARVGPHPEGDGLLVLLRPRDKLEAEVLPWLRQGLPRGEGKGTWVFVRVAATSRQLFDYDRGSLDRQGLSVPRGSRTWQDSKHGFVAAVLRNKDTSRPYALLVSDSKHLEPMGLLMLEVQDRSSACTGRGALLEGLNHCEGRGCASRYVCSALCHSCPDGRSIPQIRRSGSVELGNSHSMEVFEPGFLRIDPAWVGCAGGIGSLAMGVPIDYAGWMARPPAQRAHPAPRMAIGFETRLVRDLPGGSLGPLCRHSSIWTQQQGLGGLGPLAALLGHRGGITVPEGHLLTGFLIEAFSGAGESGSPVRSARLVWWSRALPEGFGPLHRMLCSSPRVPVETGCLRVLESMPLTVPDGFALTSLCLSMADVDGALMASFTASAIWVSCSLVSGWDSVAHRG